MRISSWAAMTKPHRGRQWHCRTTRTFSPRCASPPQETQWPDARSKHIKRSPSCGNSTPRYVFPVSKTWCLIDGPKTSRDTKKGCGKPGYQNDPPQAFAHGGGVIGQSFRSWHQREMSGGLVTKSPCHVAWLLRLDSVSRNIIGSSISGSRHARPRAEYL